MSGLTIGRLALVMSAVFALGACEDGKLSLGQGAATSGEDQTASASTADDATFSLVERDVEAPEAFKLTDTGLWDGRPSLGGVWVAYASVKDPERVMIRNTANGKSVVGALFRREVANPGPSIQVSSDAADALGMLAGQPAKLEVVALKREQPEEPESKAAVAEVASGTEPASGTDSAASPTEAAKPAKSDGSTTSANGELDPIAAAAAVAIDRAEGKPAATEASSGEATAAEGASADATEEPAPAKKCPFWRKKKCEAEMAAAEGMPPESAASAEVAAGTGAAGATTGAIATQPLATEAVPATPAAAGTLSRAYVQIGIFSVEANAQRAADQMKAAGMTATVKADQSQGKKFWRVIVGPAASVAERDSLAARVKGIGYPDAYPVSK